MALDPEATARTLRRSWSPATGRQWTRENQAAGQCNVTALLVHELHGGELLKTPPPAGDHFYNRIAGTRHDFTASQLAEPIEYSDLPATRAEAEQGIADAELAALRAAFSAHSKRTN